MWREARPPPVAKSNGGAMRFGRRRRKPSAWPEGLRQFREDTTFTTCLASLNAVSLGACVSKYPGLCGATSTHHRTSYTIRQGSTCQDASKDELGLAARQDVRPQVAPNDDPSQKMARDAARASTHICHMTPTKARCPGRSAQSLLASTPHLVKLVRVNLELLASVGRVQGLSIEIASRSRVRADVGKARGSTSKASCATKNRVCALNSSGCQAGKEVDVSGAWKQAECTMRAAQHLH